MFVVVSLVCVYVSGSQYFRVSSCMGSWRAPALSQADSHSICPPPSLSWQDQCLFTHTRVRAQGLMSSSQCTLDFCVSRLGYPILLDDRRRQESYFLYNLREQRGAAKVWSGLNFSASKVTLTLAECEEVISCSSFASCFIVINISPHLISCFLLPSCLLNLLLLVW